LSWGSQVKWGLKRKNEKCNAQAPTYSSFISKTNKQKNKQKLHYYYDNKEISMTLKKKV